MFYLTTHSTHFTYSYISFLPSTFITIFLLLFWGFCLFVVFEVWFFISVMFFCVCFFVVVCISLFWVSVFFCGYLGIGDFCVVIWVGERFYLLLLLKKEEFILL